MARVFLSQAAFDDLLRLEEFLAGSEDPMTGGLLDFIWSIRQLNYALALIGAQGFITRVCCLARGRRGWIPAFAGMTGGGWIPACDQVKGGRRRSDLTFSSSSRSMPWP